MLSILSQKNFKRLFLASLMVLFDAFLLQAVTTTPWGEYAKKSDEWYRSQDGRIVVENLLSWQDNNGAWPKNLDTAANPFKGDKKDLHGTYDNGATTPQIRFLARAYKITKDQRCLDAIDKALDLIVKAQYPTGGWPQSYPPDNKYHRFITFNDNAMIRIMRLLQDVCYSRKFDFLDKKRQQAIRQSFQKGIYCILKCQIVVNGKLTVWCAQHDEIDYSPRMGRKYELVSMSGSESVGILDFLMSLDNPNPEIIRSIKGGAEWFESSKLIGIRQTKDNGNKVIIKDKNAPPLWARFYEIETNRPFFSDREGIKKYDIAEIEPERRNGYAWYGEWAAHVPDNYAKWKEKWLQSSTSMDEKHESGNVKQSMDKANAVVAADGSGQFKTVQDAVNAAPQNASQPYIIYIKSGVYREMIVVPSEKRFIRFVGENPENTVLTYHLDANRFGDDGKPIGTFKTASTYIQGTDFQAENITFENLFGIGSQALAISVEGDRAIFHNCRFLGWQDTVLLNSGRQYFKNCYIAGHVDFIFGAAMALFDRCTVHCRAKGYITAASTPEDQPYGFIFLNCEITGIPEAKKSYLGRPWRSFANVIFLNTKMADVIDPTGWNNWRDPAREKTARYVEYNSTGPGANSKDRVSWAKRMTDVEAKAITVQAVLGGKDNWNPQ